MKKTIPFLLLLVLLIASCDKPTTSTSPTDSDSSDTSGEYSQAYAERIEGMQSINVQVNDEDKTTGVIVDYNESAPLGSSAHPLSTAESDYLEIVTFEQPYEYGDAYLITAGNASIVIDMGNSSNSSFSDGTTYFDLLKNTYDQYLADGHLDLLILTHPHADHYGGYPALKSAVSSIDMIVDYGYYYSGGESYRRNIRDYYVNAGTEYHRIYDMVHETNSGMKRTYITSELFIDWLDTGYYQETYSSGPTVDDLNVTSVAGILAYREFSYFFSGDLQDNSDGYDGSGGLGESNLVSLNSTDTARFHKVTMMKAAHHGSSKANNNVLLNVLQPKIVTISAGAPDPSTSYGGKTGVCGGHPHYAALARYLTQGSKRIVPKLFLNFVNGTTSFVTDGLTSVYMEGAPLHMSYQGTYGSGQISKVYGAIDDIHHHIQETSWASVCHGL